MDIVQPSSFPANISPFGLNMTTPPIHIINGFQNEFGGSEQEAIHLSRLLRRSGEVRMWSTSSRSSRSLAKKHGIHPIGLGPTSHPNGGIHVFVGSHWRGKLWPYLSQPPERLIYVFNTFHPKLLGLTSRHPRLLRWPRTEYVFISEFQKALLATEGEVHPSPIDIASFKPADHPPRARLVIGRLSRDVIEKYHADDIELYRTWIQRGTAVRLQGASCLRTTGIDRAVELLDEGVIPAPDFLRGLDIFFYRTGAHVETYGRVVAEAMACGLPVVCGRHGGYAELIQHGKNGFLFDTNAQALDIMAALIADPALRASIGREARLTIEAIYAPEAMENRAHFYSRRQMTTTKFAIQESGLPEFGR
jgi:glycosyltransferase involved in cell wall biosynthesis